MAEEAFWRAGGLVPVHPILDPNLTLLGGLRTSPLERPERHAPGHPPGPALSPARRRAGSPCTAAARRAATRAAWPPGGLRPRPPGRRGPAARRGNGRVLELRDQRPPARGGPGRGGGRPVGRLGTRA